MTKSQRQAIKDIEKLDDSLDLLRENMAVCSEKNKPRYMGLIDKVLDERLDLMSIRDGKKKEKPVNV
jgi:hypothetical protein